MKKLKIVTIMFLFAFGLFNTVAMAKPASVMLREGLYAEEVEGDIDAAIEIYEQIIQDSSASRDNVAQALYRQGMCYLKKKDESGAKAAFGKLAAEYGDQTEIIEKAKPYLNDLMEYDPADLMPPDTLIYVELGSPGEQIETILNMLKGTPFENPLAAIGGPGSPAGPGGKSPGDMMGALLNPSMMAEFKKIRGMAVGITEFREVQMGPPPFIAVLYPGKSDALRGIILAGLGMAGQRSEPVEGMETLNIQNSASVAYDDKVIIIAQPARLEWCIKQYKGVTSEPTLASSNKSFAKVSKKTRQDNFLTFWANVDEAYAGISKQFASGQVLNQILWANAIVDFNSIDDWIASYSIVESGLVYKSDVSFKDGHHCLAYDMFRTPNLSKAALEAVPSDAIAIVSMALGQADGAQAKVVSEKIQKVTGLDIGREIFANVEQVILFAMPSDANFISNVPILPNIGLAVTSHNPQQTRQIITTLLGTANLMTGGQQANQADTSSDGYQIGIVGGQKLYCYMNQVNKTTLLSMNKDITEACIAAIKQGKSVCNEGLLRDSISKLSPATSKLVLVNVGGAIRVATPAIIGHLKDSDREKMQQALEQLAKSCKQTTVEVRTDEQLNNYTEYAVISGLPPLNEVFGPITEISKVVSQAKAKAELWERGAGIPAIVAQATKMPVIDGTAEDTWSAACQYKLENVIYSSVSSANDLSADYKAMWDQNNLYLFVDVRDDVLKNDSNEYYYDDAVEVFIDADNAKSGEYGENDHSYYFKWGGTNTTMGDRGQPYLKDDIKFALVKIDNGYRLEVAFPWSTLGTEPSTGDKIGLDIHVNDDDDGAERDTKLTWRDKQDNAWQNPQVFGTAELAGLIGWWKFDETEGATAKDSSGNNHNGILIGNAKWAQGKIGGAVDLDGKSGFVQIADKSAFNIAGQITIACWTNFRSVPTEYAAIVTKGDNSWRLSTAQYQRKFHASVNDWQQLTLESSIEVAPNQWHHAAMVYDGQKICIYIDGKLEICKTWTGGIGGNDFDVLIGENAERKGRFFDGLIDDVRIYNYALKDSDIMALFNEGAK